MITSEPETLLVYNMEIYIYIACFANSPMQCKCRKGLGLRSPGLGHLSPIGGFQGRVASLSSRQRRKRARLRVTAFAPARVRQQVDPWRDVLTLAGDTSRWPLTLPYLKAHDFT